MTKTIIAILLVALVGLGLYTRSLKAELASEDATVEKSDKSIKVLVFMEDFINSVLDVPGTVDFETRLRLENEVRDTKDADVLTAWKAFTESKQDVDAQQKVVELLKVLTAKLKAGN